MAKSKSFFGLRKGSTKSMTFSTLNGQQVTKDRVSEVRNPKTSGQAVQRMKLAPAQKFYEAFEGILNHSWQGVEYGNKSRQKFMAEALKQNGGPYVVKGYPSLVPATYPLASGSLAKVDVAFTADSDIAITSLRVGNLEDQPISVFINAIVTMNPGFELEDKISLVCILKNTSTGSYSPMKKQLILKDTLAADESDDRAELISVMQSSSEGMLSFALDDAPFSSNTHSLVGLGIIHSRGEGSSAKRSETRMALMDSEYQRFYSDAAYTLALASYQSESGVPVSDDWYLNCFAAGKIGRVVNKAVTFTNDGHQYTVNYLTLVIDVAGVQKEYVFIKESQFLVNNIGENCTLPDGTTQVTATMAGLNSAASMAWSSDYLQLYSGF